MLLLLPFYLLGILACIGAGALIHRRLPVSLQVSALQHSLSRGMQSYSSESSFSAFAHLGWLGITGICVLTFTGMLLNLAFPLQPLGTALLLLAAIPAFPILRSVFRNQKSDSDSLKIKHSPLRIRNFSAFQLFSVSAFFFLPLVFSSRPIQHGDTGLYHLQAMLWMADSSIVPGLGNLHERFGFNSAWWCFAALFEVPFLPTGSGAFFPVALLTFFTGLIFCRSLQQIWTSRATLPDWFLLPATYLWIRQLTGENNPSLSTDAPTNLFVLLSAVALLRWIETPARPPHWLFIWSLTAVTAASTKLTGYPWLAGSTALVLFLLISQRSDSRNPSPLKNQHSPLNTGSFSVIQLFSVSAFLISLDLLRGVLLSGYPLYPVRIAGFPDLPWAMPTSFVVESADKIRNWPTRATDGAGNFEFVWIWIENQFGLTNILFAGALLTTLLLGIGLLLVLCGPRVCWNIFRSRFPLLLTLLVGFLVCFSFAPALRFVSGYFFALAGLTFGLLILALPSLITQSSKFKIQNLLAILIPLFSILANLPGMGNRPISFLSTPRMPEVMTAEQVLQCGATVPYVVNGFSWNAPPPLAPHETPILHALTNKEGKITAFFIPE